MLILVFDFELLDDANKTIPGHNKNVTTLQHAFLFKKVHSSILI